MKHGFGHRDAEGTEAAEGGRLQVAGSWLQVGRSQTSASQSVSVGLTWTGLDFIFTIYDLRFTRGSARGGFLAWVLLTFT